MGMYADEVNYWKTGKSSPDTIIANAKKEIENVGGVILGDGFLSAMGESTYMLAFELDGEKYKIIWPMLQPKKSTPTNELAAKRQAATILYHDIKSRCVAMKVLGARKAFFNFLMLPDGRVASDVGQDEFMQANINDLFLPSNTVINEEQSHG